MTAPRPPGPAAAPRRRASVAPVSAPPDRDGSPLRVCVDARLSDDRPGGVRQALAGLARGLSSLEGPEEYLFLAYRDASGFLAEHLRGPCRLLACDRPARGRAWRALAPWRSAARRRLPLADRLATGLAARLPVRLAASDGLVEGAGARVMHFALQQGFATSLPSVYTPHDLQHRHHPELFSPLELKRREVLYPALCRRAAQVVALSRWGKRDLVDELGLPEDKVRVIGLAPALEPGAPPSAADLSAVRARLRLPPDFALYPAQTFRHKNHLRLLEALALLRDRSGLRVELVCSGQQGDHFPAVEAAVARLALGSQVRFVGFVSPPELAALYHLSRLVVFPSLFEGYGMPVQEAFAAGAPVASSNAACLPELAGDAALLFDPGSVEEMAEAVRRLWTDPELRRELVRRGERRVAGACWASVARSHRALYRLVGGAPLAGGDRALLAAMT